MITLMNAFVPFCRGRADRSPAFVLGVVAFSLILLNFNELFCRKTDSAYISPVTVRASFFNDSTFDITALGWRFRPYFEIECNVLSGQQDGCVSVLLNINVVDYRSEGNAARSNDINGQPFSLFIGKLICIENDDDDNDVKIGSYVDLLPIYHLAIKGAAHFDSGGSIMIEGDVEDYIWIIPDRNPMEGQVYKVSAN